MSYSLEVQRKRNKLPMTSKVDLRENITTEEFNSTTQEERFQNQTLRSILKLQNELVLALFKNHIIASKNTFYSLSLENKKLFIENSLQKNIVLKSQLVGMTIGMLTSEEFEEYNTQTSVYNKRIMGLVIERVRSQLNLL